MPQGVGERCAGYLSSDGRYAYCTREEHAGELEANEGTSPPAFAHLIDGECRCGLSHGARLNGHSPGRTSGVRIHPKSGRETGALSWYAQHTGLDREFLASIDELDEDGDKLVFAFPGLRAERIRVTGDEKKIFWRNAVVPPPFWPMPADELPDVLVLTEGESDYCTARHHGYDALAFVLGAPAVPPHAALLALAERGVQKLVVAGDADEAGTTWAQRVAQAAHAAGLTAAVVDLRSLFPPFGSDFKDLNDLHRLCDSTKEFCGAIERATVEVEAPADETVSLDDFLKVAEREIPWLIEDLLARGEIGLIAAPQKTYKTWLAIVLIRALATGGEFLQPGWHSTGNYSVLVVEEEGSEVKFAQRFRTADFKGNVSVRFRKGSDLTSTAFADALIAQIKEGEYDVLVLDPLQRMAPGVNENDAGEMGRLWDNVHRIARECPSLAIILLHHFNKGAELGWRGIRGSSRTGGEVDVAFFLEKQDGGSLKLAIDGRDIPQYLDASDALEVSVEIDQRERVLAMEVRGTVKIKVRAVSPIRAAIEEFLRKQGDSPQSTDDVRLAVAATVGKPPTSEGVRKQLRALESEGLVAGHVVGTQGAKGWTWVQA